jgi:4-diphosphocytidyl-2-C-methyl-D-erythritol kinase
MLAKILSKQYFAFWSGFGLDRTMAGRRKLTDRNKNLLNWLIAMINQIDVDSPAKINLCLHVLGRYENGYHALAMAMQRVDLCDHIGIRIAGSKGVTVQCNGLALAPGEDNIAARAACLLLAETRADVGVEIQIDKRIPVAAGLGGGSSNAATVLLALNDMLGLNMSNQRLQQLGAQLGADVPFFVFQRPAWATGTGTTLSPLPPLPEVAYLLVNPGITVPTAEVYQSLQLTKGGELANLPRFSVETKEDLCTALYNDLERVTLRRHPVLQHIKQRLLQLGARGALMSGSGATLFGVFDDLDQAQSAADILTAETDWWTCPVSPL